MKTVPNAKTIKYFYKEEKAANAAFSLCIINVFAMNESAARSTKYSCRLDSSIRNNFCRLPMKTVPNAKTIKYFYEEEKAANAAFSLC